MHGTFPPIAPLREPNSPIASLYVSLAFAAIPLVLATILAAIRFGSAVSASDLLEILRAAALATP
jgi:hypothetical protein